MKDNFKAMIEKEIDKAIKDREWYLEIQDDGARYYDGLIDAYNKVLANLN